MKQKIKADRFFGKIQKFAWILLSLAALYIFAFTGEICVNPADNLGLINIIPELIENVLGGCIVLLGGGVLFEYLTSD